MAYTSANMGLKIWNLITDLFSHSDLASNLATIDTHDHSNGKGVQITGAGIAPLAITGGKIAAATITQDKLALGAGQLPLTTISAATTATPGQQINVSGGTPLTITLPTGPAGAVVGINASGASVSGDSPVTVASSGGQAIFAPGLGTTGAASFLLGEQGASVKLQCQGSYWVMTQGEPDTGWMSLTMGARSTSTTAAARLRGDRVTFKGSVTTTGELDFGNNWFTVPNPIKRIGNSVGLGDGATVVWQNATDSSVKNSLVSFSATGGFIAEFGAIPTGSVLYLEQLGFTKNWTD